MAFDKRSGFFFVSATGDGSIYRGKLGDTATPVPVFIPGAPGQSATGLKVQRGKLYAAGAAHGHDQGLRRRQRRAAGDVRHQGRRQLADLRQRPRRHQARRRLRDRLQAPRDLPPDGGGDRRRHAGAQADRPDDVISTSPEIPFNAAPAAFNLNGIVVDDDRGDDQGRHHGDRHRHHGDRRGDKLIVVDSDTGQLFRVKVGKGGNAARKIRELKVKGGPFPGGDGLLIDRGRLLVVQGSNPADGFPNGVVDFIDAAPRRPQGRARGPAHRRLLPGAVDHRARP